METAASASEVGRNAHFGAKQGEDVLEAFSLEMNWDEVRPENDVGTRWPMGLTVWFSVLASAALWGGILALIRII